MEAVLFPPFTHLLNGGDKAKLKQTCREFVVKINGEFGSSFFSSLVGIIIEDFLWYVFFFSFSRDYILFKGGGLKVDV